MNVLHSSFNDVGLSHTNTPADFSAAHLLLDCLKKSQVAVLARAVAGPLVQAHLSN